MKWQMSEISGLIYTNDIILYNEFCLGKTCYKLVKEEHKPFDITISWCEFAEGEPPAYDITKIPPKCIHMDNILKYKEEQLKKQMWEKLVDRQ